MAARGGIYTKKFTHNLQKSGKMAYFAPLQGKNFKFLCMTSTPARQNFLFFCQFALTLIALNVNIFGGAEKGGRFSAETGR